MRRFLKNWITGADDAASALQAVQAVGQLTQPSLDALQQNEPLFKAIAEVIKDSGDLGPLVAAGVAGVAVVPIAPLISLAAGGLVIGCRLKARRENQRQQGEQKYLLNTIWAAVASLESDDRARHLQILRALEEHRVKLEAMVVPPAAGVFDGANVKALADRMGIDLESIHRRLEGIEERLRVLESGQQNAVLVANRILEIVAQAPTMRELDTGFAEMRGQFADLAQRIEGLEQLLKPSAEQQLGLYIPKRREGSNAEAGSRHLLEFAERLVEQPVGRESEWEWLQQFLSCDGGFRWTVLTGKGGAGKSRLALELVLAHALDWRVGFVDRNGRASRLQGFQGPLPPDRPTLLVLDYIQGDTNAIIAFLKRFTTHEPEAKLRVLLLDRVFEGYGFARDIEKAIGSHRYQPPDNAPRELRLEGLEPPAFAEVFQHAHQALQRQDAPRESLDRLQDTFGSRPSDRLPLIACLAAMYVAEGGQDLGAWTSEHLKTWYFEHVARHWTNLDNVQSALHAVCLSTTTGGADQAMRTWVDGGAIGGMSTEGWGTAHRIVGSVPTESTLPAYEPDPLGEFFVRLRLQSRALVGDDDAQIGLTTRAMLTELLREPALLKGDSALSALVRLMPVLLASDLKPTVLERTPSFPERLVQAVARSGHDPEVRAVLDHLDFSKFKMVSSDLDASGVHYASEASSFDWENQNTRELERILASLED